MTIKAEELLHECPNPFADRSPVRLRSGSGDWRIEIVGATENPLVQFCPYCGEELPPPEKIVITVNK